MRTRVHVIQGRLAESEPHRTSAIEAAYQHFRLDKQGSLVSPKTLRHYDGMIRPFLRWLEEEHPGVGRFEQLGVDLVREYRVGVAQRPTNRGRPPEPATLNDLHRRLMTFLRWAEDEGYAVDTRMRRLKAPRVPLKEATVLHIAQLRDVFAACDPERPQEELTVRMLVGSGVRAAELCGLAVRGPDGLPDLMLDSLARDRLVVPDPIGWATQRMWYGAGHDIRRAHYTLENRCRVEGSRHEQSCRPKSGACQRLRPGAL